MSCPSTWGLYEWCILFFIIFHFPWYECSPPNYKSYCNCRDNYDTWNMLAKARTEGRLFQKLKWPKEAELVCFLWHLYLLSLCVLSQIVCDIMSLSTQYICRKHKWVDCILCLPSKTLPQIFLKILRLEGGYSFSLILYLWRCL